MTGRSSISAYYIACLDVTTTTTTTNLDQGPGKKARKGAVVANLDLGGSGGIVV